MKVKISAVLLLAGAFLLGSATLRAKNMTLTGEVGDEGDLGAARPQAVRYDLEVYGFDASKLRFSSTKQIGRAHV